MAAADAGSKWLIGHSPQAWVSWLLLDQASRVEAELSTEFQLFLRPNCEKVRFRQQASDQYLANNDYVILNGAQRREESHPTSAAASTLKGIPRYRSE